MPIANGYDDAMNCRVPNWPSMFTGPDYVEYINDYIRGSNDRWNAVVKAKPGDIPVLDLELS